MYQPEKKSHFCQIFYQLAFNLWELPILFYHLQIISNAFVMQKKKKKIGFHNDLFFIT